MGSEMCIRDRPEFGVLPRQDIYSGTDSWMIGGVKQTVFANFPTITGSFASQTTPTAGVANVPLWGCENNGVSGTAYTTCSRCPAGRASNASRRAHLQPSAQRLAGALPRPHNGSTAISTRTCTRPSWPRAGHHHVVLHRLHRQPVHRPVLLDGHV